MSEHPPRQTVGLSASIQDPEPLARAPPRPPGNSLYNTCGGKTPTYPQPTIYDNMRSNNVSFALYVNNTGAADWPGAYLTPVDMPDVILQGVARYRSEFRNHTDFYTRAAEGTLPAVSCEPGPMTSRSESRLSLSRDPGVVSTRSSVPY